MPRDVFPELKSMFGKPIDSEEVVKFLAKYPKHKVTKPSDGHQYVTAPTHGFDMDFGPPGGGYHGGRTKEKRVLTTVFLNSKAVPKFEPFANLPLGLSFDHSPDQLIAKFGSPYRARTRDTGEIDWAKWHVDGLVLRAKFNDDKPTTMVFSLTTPAVAAQFD